MEQQEYQPTLSVIIPTWNEEYWLPRLLCSLPPIREITEVIVVDNQSTDNTVAIAKQHGCKTMPGGTPGRARNAGATIARGEILLFIDADAMINSDVVRYVKEHFSSPEVVAVHFPLCPISSNYFSLVCYKIMDWYFWLLANIGLSQGVGTFMAIRRAAFVDVSGFREDLLVGEDADMFRRLNSLGEVRYERKAVVHVSTRRFTIENPLFFAMKCLVWAVLRLLGFKVSLFPYIWTRYPSFISVREEQAARGILVSHSG